MLKNYAKIKRQVRKKIFYSILQAIKTNLNLCISLIGKLISTQNPIKLCLAFFKKKKNELPSFDYMENSFMRDKYFCRTLQWDFLNAEMIHIFDHKGSTPRMITMDP